MSASALNELTGVQVWTGGQLLRIVDLDTGAVTAARGVSMLPDEYIDELATVGADTFALSARCDFTLKRRVIRTGADGRSVVIPISRQLDGLIADSDKAWGVDYPETGVGPTVMVALDGSGVVAVPVGIEPTAVFENTLVGLRSPVGGTSPEHPGHVVLFDLATRKLRADLGPGSSLTVGAGAILWIEDRCPGYAPCQIHRFDLTTGKFSLRNCLLPRDAVLSGGVVSQDGRLLGLDLQRRNPDPRFDSGSPGPPSDVAILHLDTGALDVVPGIELAPKSSAAITFSADSRWVVIALNEGEHGRVLVWRPGLAKPMDPSLLLPGSVLYQLPVALNGIG